MPQSDAQKKASVKYKQKSIKRIPLDMQIDEYERLKEHVDKLGIPVNTYIKELIRRDIDKE